jgi:hypothetical protein
MSEVRPDESISVMRPFFTSGGGFFHREKTRRRPNQWRMTKLRLLTDACIIRRGGFVESLGTRGIANVGRSNHFIFANPPPPASSMAKRRRRSYSDCILVNTSQIYMSHTQSSGSTNRFLVAFERISHLWGVSWDFLRP